MTAPPRLTEPANGTADGAGNLTIKFRPVDTNTVWTGAVLIANAPASASWTASRDGVPVFGSAVGGQALQVEALDGEVVSLTGSGFVANQTYTAYWSGWKQQRDSVQSWLAPFPGTTH